MGLLWYNRVMINTNNINANIAWAAGLFEGEGNIAFTGKNSVSLQIGSTDLDCLEKLQDVLSLGAIYGPKLKDGRKPFYTWNLGRGPDVKRVLELFIPWFCSRRLVRAQEAIDRLKGGRCKNYDEIIHGTTGGYKTEIRRGILTCDKCRLALTTYKKDRKLIKEEIGES